MFIEMAVPIAWGVVLQRRQNAMPTKAPTDKGLPHIDNWVAEFSLTDESDVLDDFTLDEQAKIWGLMRTAWNTARERTAARVQAGARLAARLDEYTFIAQMISGIEKEDWYKRRIAELIMLKEGS